MLCPAGGEIYVTQEERYEVLPGTENVPGRTCIVPPDVSVLCLCRDKVRYCSRLFLDISVDSVGNLLYYLISTIVH